MDKEDCIYENVQVIYRRFLSTKPDGSGFMKIVDSNKISAPVDSMQVKDKKVRDLFREVKKDIDMII